MRFLHVDLDDLSGWTPVVTQVREIILRGHIAGVEFLINALPPEALPFVPRQHEVDEIAETAETAVRAGRLIDFGNLPNEVIRHGGNRGGPLYSQGAIGHPFSQPYVFMHTWGEDMAAVYLVTPLEPDKLAGGDCEAIELQPVKVAGEAALIISDRILLEPDRDPNHHQYYCSAIPAVWRFLPGAPNQGKPPAHAAGGNVLDPLMTGLLILNTRGIARETVAVSDKLQKARRKSGKPPIPPYDRVMSAPYVTAIEARRARGRNEPKGGTHASPIPHLRMGHPRTYASGVKCFVRDALVNMSDEAKQQWQAGRSHYAVRP